MSRRECHILQLEMWFMRRAGRLKVGDVILYRPDIKGRSFSSYQVEHTCAYPKGVHCLFFLEGDSGSECQDSFR